MSNTTEFNTLGDLGFTGTLNDRRKRFYEDAGYPNESQYLASLGYTGTLNDMRYQLAVANSTNMSGFLLAGGTPGLGGGGGGPYDIAFDITAATPTYNTQSGSISGLTSYGLGIARDGTYMFATDSGDNDRVRAYSMSTPYDLTTLSTTASSEVTMVTWTGNGVRVAGPICFNDDGTKMYTSHFSVFAELTLTTPYDLSTADSVVTVAHPLGASQETWVWVHPNGIDVLMGRNNTGLTYHRQFNSQFDLSAGLTAVTSVTMPNNLSYCRQFNQAGDKILVNSYQTYDRIEQHNVSTPGDFSTVNTTEETEFNYSATIGGIDSFVGFVYNGYFWYTDYTQGRFENYNLNNA